MKDGETIAQQLDRDQGSLPVCGRLNRKYSRTLDWAERMATERDKGPTRYLTAKQEKAFRKRLGVVVTEPSRG